MRLALLKWPANQVLDLPEAGSHGALFGTDARFDYNQQIDLDGDGSSFADPKNSSVERVGDWLP